MTKASRTKLGKSIQAALDGVNVRVHHHAVCIMASQLRFPKAEIQLTEDVVRIFDGTDDRGCVWFEFRLSAVEKVWRAKELPRFCLTMNDDSDLYLDGSVEYW